MLDLSRVPNLARRQELLAVLKEAEAVRAARDAAVEAAAAPFYEKLDALDNRASELGIFSMTDNIEDNLCAVSGLPICDDDDVYNQGYRARILACLLPPLRERKQEETDEEIEEAA